MNSSADNQNKHWKKATDRWDLESKRSAKGIKSAPSPKIQKDYSPNTESTSTAPSSHAERQKTIKTNASLVDKLGAFQMAMGYKNRTEAFEHVFKAGATKLLTTKDGAKKRYREAYNLIHK